MKCDFIEIGTCDFDNLISNATTEIGISIEPVKVYFDNLPNKANVIKLNCAIGDIDFIETTYWVSPDDILKYNLPYWMRGCSKIGEIHPLIHRELMNRDILNICQKTECTIISWNTLIEKYSIESVEFLKIDTEGFEYKILNNLLNSNSSVYPKRIQFEDKDFTDEIELNNILTKFSNIGYVVSKADHFDYLLTLND
jgi:FkbM family methyltransferase